MNIFKRTEEKCGVVKIEARGGAGGNDQETNPYEHIKGSYTTEYGKKNEFVVTSNGNIVYIKDGKKGFWSQGGATTQEEMDKFCKTKQNKADKIKKWLANPKTKYKYEYCRGLIEYPDRHKQRTLADYKLLAYFDMI